jgi:multiple sugar transport system permease protein
LAVVTTQRRRRSELRRREAVAGYLFVVPWLVALLVFTAYPVLAALFFSFTEYNILQPPEWVGLQNYEAMLSEDPSFWTGVGNSAVYAVMAVPLTLAVSLALALILSTRATGIGFYRTVFYLPSLAPPVAGAVVFMLLFSPSQGLVNAALGFLGLRPPDWFLDPAWAKPTLVILHLWGLGSAVLIFLAGLKEIPQTYLEAAAIDGANAWQRFRHVVVPLLTPVILFNLVMGVIYSFQVFTSAFVIGGTTGQPLESTLMFMILIYRNAFKYFKMGYASALSVVLFAVVLALTLVIFRSSGRWVHYEGGTRPG